MTTNKAGLARNSITMFGFALIFGSLASALFLLLMDLSGGERRPYLGIFYLIVPAVLIPGLVLVPFGMLLERRRRRKEPNAELKPYPTLDLNNPKQRRSAALFVCVSVGLVFASAIGSYRAYETTDSVVFCGQLCHTPMHPEFTAYQVSPHARVKCAECHVGPTPVGYVQAKFAGIHRAYAEVRGNFARPIPPPVHSLEPASATCEQCHWPEQPLGGKLKTFDHFGYDETNTPRQISMLMSIGGGNLPSGPAGGIHWHANPANEITYVATDDTRQKIPWVRLRDAKGNVVEYSLKDSEMPQDQIQHSEKHKMDCIDCHNRAGHLFLTPDRAVDLALSSGRLDPTLPYVKQQAVDVLSKPYSDSQEAVAKIAADIDSYYHTSYAALYSSKQTTVTAAIAEVQSIYRANYFPEMKADWQGYPSNIGHFTSLGCFRCHDGQHVSADGKVIPKDCSLCHSVMSQQEGSAPAVNAAAKPFQHPVDLGDLTQLNCADCHTGKGMAQ
jgi:nitrate/TMAO reductase-like tetraheme cytochrome c subunit